MPFNLNMAVVISRCWKESIVDSKLSYSGGLLCYIGLEYPCRRKVRDTGFLGNLAKL